MEVRRCAKCMEELTGDVCPKCGFDEKAAPQSPIGLRRNTVLHGRYLVGNILGQGGFGITYIGFDLLLNIKVAIKEYFPMGNVSRDHNFSNELQWNPSQLNQDQQKAGCENFLKEARKMAKIDSIPGIVRVRDTFFENKTAYIVMDFVEGVTLKASLLKSGPMKYSECIAMLMPLMKSLSEVHKQGLIHRDISPDNIMIQPDGSLRLLDLGAAKDINVNREGVSQMVTKKGFSPAEQYMESGSIGGFTDVYAMCATIYYCITGKVVPDAMERLMQDPLNFALPMKENLTKEAEEILRAGLAVKAEERIQSMEELVSRLSGNISYASTQEIRNAAIKMADFGNTENPADSGITDEKKNKKRKGLTIGISLAAVSIIAASLAIVLGVLQPWKKTIERLGTSNSNMLNDGGFAMIEEQYEYFIDQNDTLYVCTYDTEDQCFYVDYGIAVAQKARYICLGEEKVYFVLEEEDTGYYSVCQMDFDGSNVEKLYETNETVGLMQYTLLTNKDQYLYFMETEGDNAKLIRYSIEDGFAETVVDDDVWWYNVYQDSIYYTTARNNEVVLSKTNLDGKKEKVLSEGETYGYGFIENDTIYLYSMDEKALVLCDLEGNKTGAIYEATMDTSFFTFAYGDNWIYYVSADDNAIHKIRSNGTGDTIVIEGHYAVSICFVSDCIWFSEGMISQDEMQLVRTYICGKDGDWMVALQDADVKKTEDGLLYKLTGGEVTICGYVGDEINVGIPYNIEDFPVTSIEEDSLPDGHYYYLYADEDDLLCAWNETKDGVVITGYTGTLTSFMLPDYIEGYPVTEIGDSAFENSEIEQIILPKTLVKIGEKAFQFSKQLIFVNMSNQVTEIGAWAFDDCKSLTYISLPDSLKTISPFAFWGAGLTTVTIPSGVEYIGNGAFGYGSELLTDIVISEENPYYTTVDGILYTKDMQGLVCVPAGKTGSIYVPDGVMVIGDRAFAGCSSITDVTLPDSVIAIQERAFLDCSAMTDIVIPRSVIMIYDLAFQYCDSLTSITISSDCSLGSMMYSNVEVLYYED